MIEKGITAATPQQRIFEREQAELVAVMSTEAGRAVINKIIADAGALKTPYVQDSDATQFNAGMANVGLMLYARIEEACPHLYLEMRKEAQRSAQQDRHEADLARQQQGESTT